MKTYTCYEGYTEDQLKYELMFAEIMKLRKELVAIHTLLVTLDLNEEDEKRVNAMINKP